jgi:uncharacterized protein (TIGR02145 family)
MRNLVIISGVILLVFVIHSCKKDYDTFVGDVDGNVYNTVTIGTQVWMKENLRTTRFNDGSAINFITDNSEWSNSETLGYSLYDNDIRNKNIYGALYNWNTINTHILCPVGWHMPSMAEWTIMIDNTGGAMVAGGLLKESGTDHWIDPNVGATNETGFSALPGGSRNEEGTFFSKGYYGHWWSATEDDISSAWSFSLINEYTVIEKYNPSKLMGFSVRCIRD